VCEYAPNEVGYIAYKRKNRERLSKYAGVGHTE